MEPEIAITIVRVQWERTTTILRNSKVSLKETRRWEQRHHHEHHGNPWCDTSPYTSLYETGICSSTEVIPERTYYQTHEYKNGVTTELDVPIEHHDEEMQIETRNETTMTGIELSPVYHLPVFFHRIWERCQRTGIGDLAGRNYIYPGRAYYRRMLPLLTGHTYLAGVQSKYGLRMINMITPELDGNRINLNVRFLEKSL